MAFKRIFPESHFSIYDFARLSISNIFRDVQEAAGQGVAWRHSASIVWFRMMQFWGTYRGYRKSSGLTRALRERFYYPPSTGTTAVPREADPIAYKSTKR